MTLTKQEQKVYDYILNHAGCTTRDIIHDTFITCPSGRITEMRKKGVPIISVGKKRYGGGTMPFEMYAIDTKAFGFPPPLPDETKPAPKPVETSAEAKQLAMI